MRQNPDPMMELASWWMTARALRKTAEEQEEVRRQAHAAISAGPNNCWAPPATRMRPHPSPDFGTVIGYEEGGPRCGTVTAMSACTRGRQHGTAVHHSIFAALEKRKSKLNQDTHLNFVSTCDIIWGNSGSPLSTGPAALSAHLRRQSRKPPLGLPL